jgi:hypothetical protein
MADPTDDEAADPITYATGRPVHRRVARAGDIERAFERLYGTEPLVADTAQAAPAEAEDLECLRDLASEAPVIRLVNRWINRAAEAGASDIHIEPGENALRVRFRIDGVLAGIDSQSLSLHAAGVSRLKIMAKLDIAERRLTQEDSVALAVCGPPNRTIRPPLPQPAAWPGTQQCGFSPQLDEDDELCDGAGAGADARTTGDGVETRGEAAGCAAAVAPDGA